MSKTATVVRLGNPSVHESQTEEGRVVGHVHREDLAKQVTEVHLPAPEVSQLVKGAAQLEKALEQYSRESLLVRLLTADGLSEWELAFKHVAIVVSHHARAGIDWVASEDAKLQAVLAQFLGAEEGERAGYGQPEAPPLAGGSPEWDEIVGLAKSEQERWPEIERGLDGELTALKTKTGVDLIANASFGTAAQPAALNYVALTANNEAEKNTSTSLTGEIATAEGGLIRKQATYSHTAETSEAKLTVTFTANSHDSLPVTVHKFGVFNKATSGGTMGIETKVTEVTFNAAEDNATLTETLTIT